VGFFVWANEKELYSGFYLSRTEKFIRLRQTNVVYRNAEVFCNQGYNAWLCGFIQNIFFLMRLLFSSVIPD
jgi:hypothetical protein